MFMDSSCLSSLVQQTHVSADWADAAAQLIAGDFRRVVVLGAADMGKSTLCRFLVGEGRRAGRAVALLDADLGQKTVGPPACVTLAEACGTRLAFAGGTNPFPGRRRVLDGIRRLAGTAKTDLLITNTSGILVGPGRQLKAAKIELIQPDLLIALGTGTELELVLTEHAHLATFRLTRSPEARHKTKAARRAARRTAFGRYFADASVLALNRAFLEGEGDQPYPAGLLLGLAGQSGDLGLGILVGCPTSAGIEILTPAAKEDIQRITPGSLCLDQNFREMAVPIIAAACSP
jgi:polynucleotide 5'-hydroxyl-kinase GRC3/NOL9